MNGHPFPGSPAPMNPHPLDFIVFGVARSGTRALSAVLNLHPKIYCAHERFDYRVDHAAITYPDTFVESAGMRDRHQLDKLAATRREIAAKSGVVAAGNKSPGYGYALTGVNDRVPALKNIWIYRSPSGFMQSWNRKEANHRKLRWSAGRVGMFGLLDLLLYVEACTSLNKDIFVFPYDDGLNRGPHAAQKAIRFLGLDPTEFDRLTFKRRYLKRYRDDDTRQPLAPHEDEALATLEIDELDAILGQPSGFVLDSSTKVRLHDYLDRIRPRLPGAIDSAFRGYHNAAVMSYGSAHIHRHRAELASLLAITKGSAAMEEFMHNRLKHRAISLWAQRSQIRRQLAGFRPFGGE